MRPAERLLWLLLAWTLAAAVPIGWPAALPVWLALGTLLALAALVDYLARSPQPRAERHCPSALAVGVWARVRLRFYNPSPYPRVVAVFDHYPQPAGLRGQPARLTIPPQSWLDTGYRLRPLRRGAAAFGRIQTSLLTPLGLWQRDLWLGEPQPVKILPDIASIARFARLAHDQRTAAMGIHHSRRRGEGREFLQLREYRDGDSLRQIDWKATARYRTPISKEYQEERDQRVVFLLDCGRRMRTQDDRLSHFDHALNALILVGFVALRQGDAVGLSCFGGSERWLAAKKGIAALPALIDAVYDLQPTLASADFAAAANRLLHRQRRRALVIVLTNLRDEDDAELGPALTLLRRRHLVLLANLREQALDRVLRQPVGELSQAQLYAATCAYLAERERVQERLRQRGGQVLDTTPQTLPVALVNDYLRIKRSGQL